MPLILDFRRASIGEIAIKGEQQMTECGISQQVSIQRMRPPRHDDADPHGQARPKART